MSEIREFSIREALNMQLRLHETIVVRSMTRHMENRVKSNSLYELRTNDKAKILTDLANLNWISLAQRSLERRFDGLSASLASYILDFPILSQRKMPRCEDSNMALTLLLTLSPRSRPFPESDFVCRFKSSESHRLF